MARPHLVIGSLSLAAAISGTFALAIDHGPFAASAVPLISLGVLVAALTGLAGLLLARSPWGRWVLAATVILSMILASVGSSPATWVTYALGAAALVGLFGPWLRLWIRHHRLADAPGPIVVTLSAVAAAAPLYVGLSVARVGAGWIHWILVGVAVTGSVLYGRGNRAGLWILRTALPIVTVLAVSFTGGVAALALAFGGIVVTVLAWTPAAKRTTTVIAPVLPQPIERQG